MWFLVLINIIEFFNFVSKNCSRCSFEVRRGIHSVILPPKIFITISLGHPMGYSLSLKLPRDFLVVFVLDFFFISIRKYFGFPSKMSSKVFKEVLF